MTLSRQGATLLSHYPIINSSNFHLTKAFPVHLYDEAYFKISCISSPSRTKGFMDPARKLGVPGRQQLCVCVERPLQGLPRGHSEAFPRLHWRPRPEEDEQRRGVEAEREPGGVGRLGTVRVPGQHDASHLSLHETHRDR